MSAEIIPFPQHRIVRSLWTGKPDMLEALAIQVVERLQKKREEADKVRLDSLALLIAAEIDKAPPAKKTKRKK